MLILITIGILLVAILGLAAVRTASVLARWLALLAAIAFAVVINLADRTEQRPVQARLQRADLMSDLQDTRTSMLMAAALAGPRAVELQLHWQPTWPGAVGSGKSDDDLAGRSDGAVLGATAVVPAALPFSPEDIRIRAMSELRVSRPALLEIEVVGLTADLVADILIGDDANQAVRETMTISSQPVTVAFTPSRVGYHEVSLQIRVGEHQVSVSGSFQVQAPDEILVVDANSVVAAALRVQGERVRETQSWPSDWSRHSRIVLGRALPVAEQAALVEAVSDGTGLFVLPPAFGDEGAPLREVLPIRPLPMVAGDAGGSDDRSGKDGEPAPVDRPSDPEQFEEPAKPTPIAPSQPPKDLPEPPGLGDTQGAKPLSKDPVEVDKHAIAMVLVVDRSGSMGTEVSSGVSKMSYAKTSALRTAQALDVGDQVGLVTFGARGAGRMELQLTDATERVAIERGINRLLHVNENTWLLSGLRTARAMLDAESVAVKHVVIITDGEFRIEQSAALRSEAFKMRSSGKITVSIISIIDDLTDAGFKVKAQEIASDGGGAFIATKNIQAVPVIVSSEVSRALSRVGRRPRSDGSGDQPSRDPEPTPPEPLPDEPLPDEPLPDPPEPEEPEPQPDILVRLPVHAVTTSALLEPVPGAWPSLGGVAKSEAPLETRVLLVAGDDGWPLLAYANRGLGRVGVFAAELGGEDCREFRAASAFPGWLSQWLAATSSASEAVQSSDVRGLGEIVPRAPVPADVRWLTRVSGGDLVTQATQIDGGDLEVGEVVGSEVIRQAEQVAPLLLVVLLLLALGERLTSTFVLRRGRG